MPYGNLLADVVQSSTVGTPPQFNDGGGTQVGTLCRAWVNFNGSTASVRSSYNVTSVTRNSTGDYTVTFTTALTDANYAAIASVSWTSTTSRNIVDVQSNNSGSVAPTTSTVRLVSTNFSSSITYDPDYVNVAIFR